MMSLRKFLFITVGLFVLQSGLSSCSTDSDGFYFGALGLNEGRILVVNSQAAAPLQYTVTMYDLSGQFLGVVADTTNTSKVLRGLVNYNGLNLLLGSDTPDQLDLLNLFSGEITDYAVNAQLTGNIFDVSYDSATDRAYVVETNTVELFEGGARVPISGATPYINTTIGACVLNTPRGMAFTQGGRLAVVSNGNDRVNLYTVTGASSGGCYTGYTGFAGTVNPMDIISHSDGNLYITGNGSDIVYQSPEANPLVPTQIFLNIGIIDNPTAIAELPNGNLLVASDATDSIAEITTAGVVVNSSLIKDSFTGNVIDLLVIPPQ